MIDKLWVSFPADSLSTVLHEGEQRVLTDLGENEVVILRHQKAGNEGRRHIKLLYSANRVSMHSSPATFLQGHNLYGTDNMAVLYQQLLASLLQQRLITPNGSAWKTLLTGATTSINAIQFNCYIDLGPNRDSIMQLLRVMYTAVQPYLPEGVSNTLFDGNVNLMRRNSGTSLVWYDKHVHPHWMRVEVTLRGHTLSKKRKTLDYWMQQGVAGAKESIVSAMQRFGFTSLIDVPDNVLCGYRETLSLAGRRHYDLWRSGQELTAKQKHVLRSTTAIHPDFPPDAYNRLLDLRAPYKAQLRKVTPLVGRIVQATKRNYLHSQKNRDILSTRAKR